MVAFSDQGSEVEGQKPDLLFTAWYWLEEEPTLATMWNVLSSSNNTIRTALKALHAAQLSRRTLDIMGRYIVLDRGDIGMRCIARRQPLARPNHRRFPWRAYFVLHA